LQDTCDLLHYRFKKVNPSAGVVRGLTPLPGEAKADPLLRPIFEWDEADQGLKNNGGVG
jgi:hypothetical protein